jgi:hypothetical protein
MNDESFKLPPSAKSNFQRALAKCQSCLATQKYLERLGEMDQETHDRAAHLARTIETALDIDRQTPSR